MTTDTFWHKKRQSTLRKTEIHKTCIRYVVTMQQMKTVLKRQQLNSNLERQEQKVGQAVCWLGQACLLNGRGELSVA